MPELRQSTAIEVKVGPFLDSTDGNTAETALTITQADVRLAKNAGDWAQKAETTALVHEEFGNYRCLLDTTDTNTAGILRLHIHESGALPVWVSFDVIPADVYDARYVTTTAQAGAATTITLDAAASAVDDFYNGQIVYLTAGTGSGQARSITDYVGSTKVATVGTWGTNPDSTTKFVLIPFTSTALTSTDHTNIADALLKRDLSVVTGEASRSVLNAIRFLRNKWTISGGTLTVRKEDDTTSAWTAAVTRTAGDPVSEIDP